MHRLCTDENVNGAYAQEENGSGAADGGLGRLWWYGQSLFNRNGRK
jgi:hypothetical protein